MTDLDATLTKIVGARYVHHGPSAFPLSLRAPLESNLHYFAHLEVPSYDPSGRLPVWTEEG